MPKLRNAGRTYSRFISHALRWSLLGKPRSENRHSLPRRHPPEPAAVTSRLDVVTQQASQFVAKRLKAQAHIPAGLVLKKQDVNLLQRLRA
jgi:hypothetical protein